MKNPSKLFKLKRKPKKWINNKYKKIIIKIRLYDFIARNFLASISSDAAIRNLTVSFKIGEHDFSLKGTTIVNPGFT